jgi:hypothetical protein
VFFRIWFYLCKVAAVAFPAAFLGLIGGLVWQPLLWVFLVGLMLIIPMGIAGGLLGVAIYICGMKMSCPLCGQPGVPSAGRGILYLDCENCGTVYGRVGALSLFDWQLWIDAPDDEEESES